MLRVSLSVGDRYSTEFRAVRGIKTIHAAQSQYYSQHGRIEYTLLLAFVCLASAALFISAASKHRRRNIVNGLQLSKHQLKSIWRHEAYPRAEGSNRLVDPLK